MKRYLRNAQSIRTTSGAFSFGAIADGQTLKRSGGDIVGTDATKTWIKTTSPTAADDSTAGYYAGDRWVNTVNGLEWTAYSVSSGAADWRLLPLNAFSVPRHVDLISARNNSAAQMGTLV